MRSSTLLGPSVEAYGGSRVVSAAGLFNPPTSLLRSMDVETPTLAVYPVALSNSSRIWRARWEANCSLNETASSRGSRRHSWRIAVSSRRCCVETKPYIGIFLRQSEVGCLFGRGGSSGGIVLDYVAHVKEYLSKSLLHMIAGKRAEASWKPTEGRYGKGR